LRRRGQGQQIPDFFRGRMSLQEHAMSVAYARARGRFQRWAVIYDRAIILVFLFSGVLPVLDRVSSSLASWFLPVREGTGILFCFLAALFFWLAHLPIDFYATFSLEARFGFNKTPLRLYVLDKLKMAFLGLLLGIPFLYVVLWVMDATGPFWWLWAFVFITAFQFVMVIVYPTLIAPWFNKFEPLKEGEMRDRILQLADRIGFRTSGIFSMDGSKRSAHSNAYFTGIGKVKRIVLFDTLLEQMTPDQGIAVLAHEMGHYKMKHIRTMLVLQSLLLFAGLYLLSLLVDFRPLFSAFGLKQPSNHAALVLFSLLSGPATFYLTPLINLLSRKHEYEADRFAVVTLGNGQAMEEALIKLSVKNLANLTPHPWYSAYHYSHPTPGERIRAIRQCAA
ncbi:MAG TPA: M48 family metallopeptidase, partial [Terriglobales bacterium]|nr:M48 family metallopeptidase [Terriglobales bacterium]